jgi:hypothetical protein
MEARVESVTRETRFVSRERTPRIVPTVWFPKCGLADAGARYIASAAPAVAEATRTAASIESEVRRLSNGRS